MNTYQARGLAVLLIVIIGMLAGVIYLTMLETGELPIWEYCFAGPDDLSLQATINEMGNKGWEFAFARRVYDSSTETASYEMMFKRQTKGE